MVLKDTKDGTLYSAGSAADWRSRDWAKKGQRLKPVPTFVVSDWGYWLEKYPNAVAYHMFDKYKPVPLPKEPNADSVKTRSGKRDGSERDPDELVLGVRVGDKTAAYPLTALERDGLIGTYVIPRRIGDEEVVIIFHWQTRTCGVYKPIAHPPRKFKAPNPDKDGISPMDDGVPLPVGSEAKKPRRVTLETAGVNGPLTSPERAPRASVSQQGISGRMGCHRPPRPSRGS